MFVLPILVLTLLYSYRTLGLAQHNGYRLLVSRQRVAFFLAKMGIIAAFAVPTFILAGIWQYVFPIAEILCGVAIVLFENKGARTKASFTPRFWRLYLMFLAVVVAIITVVMLLSDYRFIFVVPMAYLPISYACLLLTTPFEALNNRRYVNHATRCFADCGAIKIAVTGSAGKTSVKGMLESILSTRYSVLAGQNNYNTPLGMSKIISQYCGQEVIIVEFGARNVGDIADLCDVVMPDIGVVTNVLPQHLATFKSIDNVANEKGVLACRALRAAVLNGKNPYTAAMCNPTETIIVGCEDREIRNIESTLEGTSFDYCEKGLCLRLFTPQCGAKTAENAALAVAVARFLGVNFSDISTGLRNYHGVPHRFEVSSAANGVTIVDDSYNANFEGAVSALNLLKADGRRLVVLSQGLVECGVAQYELNVALGREIAKCADEVILIGPNAVAIKEGAVAEKADFMVTIVKDLNEAQNIFPYKLKAGDVLYIQNDLPDVY